MILLLALGKGMKRGHKMEAFLNTVSGCELQNTTVVQDS